MSRSPNIPAAAARLLLLSSLPLALAYPQMIPPFELLNATSDAVPVSTSAVVPEETPIYNYSDPSITYDYFTASPVPTSTSSSSVDFYGFTTTDSAPEATATVISDPGMTTPLDPIFMPSSVYPFPTTPDVSVKTFLAVVQPLLDIIQNLLPPSTVRDVFGPYSSESLEMKKRSTEAVGTGLPTGLPTGILDVNTLIVALVKQALAILNSTPADSVTKAVPLDAATGAVGTVTNTAGGLPVGAVTGTVGGATGGLLVVGGLTGGSIASRALRRRQLSGLGSVVSAPKAVPPLVQSITGAATGSTGSLPVVGSLPVNPGSVVSTATGAVSGKTGSLPGVGSLPVNPNSVLNTATGGAGSVAAGVPLVNNVVPGGISVTGSLPTSLDPASIANTVTGAAGGVSLAGNLPVNPSTVVGTVTNALPAPAANLVPSNVTSTISPAQLSVVISLLNAAISLLLGNLNLDIVGGLTKRSTDVSLSSPTHAEFYKREAFYPVPVRTMRHEERKRQGTNVNFGASSLDNAAHLSNGELMALLGADGSLDPMGLMAQEDQSEDAYYSSAPGGANSAEQYYPPMGDDVVPAFEGYSE
ncbi:hypothetical protein PtrSN002B_006601 [Pyrenophora tritici-repentis]|uniref:Uncharacterized protein n=2 Tax=Pyrenophora tritici-repentis TaxID=45151 RepID=A0A2W1G9F7_9PLEO|nr:uncharacterized protein PTRG_07966 [Pyrenophora tritici-repentis Pt-1C-BFP]KAA8616689.1 hypothetical protein PtrV1_09990 [Pyrenophora tritici-repentis]EDU50885.1 predicted protein [Pyrenophora tritici-repentis Pt-1C-BFP]KAF7445984.1 hypothetical protein A1F99_092750 [Pyrenophora tritici-repentis]KAF7567081.1 hypothetical protein PtrM4_136720 [Pyrenophora tritici-repentis]KAI0575916.1 hypothetical protein Alg215_07748 [Pyrenophora tritici-repentis]